MKRISVLFFIFLFASDIFAKEISGAEKKFIRGNIKEKIEAVEEADKESALKMGTKGLDYALSNVDALGSDSELSSLAEASMLTLVKNGGIESLDDEKSKPVSDKVLKIFSKFDDENVKITAVDCLSRFKSVKWNGSADVLDEYLEERYRENHPGNLLIGNIISFLGENGGAHSFTLIYNIYLNGSWPEYKNVTEKSLASLSFSLPDEAGKVVLYGDYKTVLNYLELIKKYDANDKNNKNLIQNLAESALFSAINNVESSQEFSRDFYLVQKETLEILSRAKWSHAQNIVAKNFDVAKKEYEMKIISDDEFIEIINLTAKFSSPEIAEAFSKLLGEFNSKAENTEIPSEPVVLALINSLGEMGAKTAFDNLLNTTYLNYSAKVIDAAKEALAKLKW